MLLRMALGGIRHSRRRLAVAFLALALSALGLAAGSAMVLDLGPRLGQALSGLGPDVLFVATTPGPLEPRLAPLLPGVALATVALAVVDAEGPLVALGTDLSPYRLLHSYMQVTGTWPASPDQAAAGIDLARRLGLMPGSTLSIAGPSGKARLTVTAVVESGGEEDQRLVLDRSILQRISPSVDPEAVEARLPGEESAVARAAGTAASAAGARFEMIMATALAQGLAYRRAGTIAAPVLALVVLTAGLTVFATWTSMLLARRKEIALLLSLGSSARQLTAILSLEALLVSVWAGILGALAGLPAARALGRWVFALPTRAEPLAVLAAAAMVVALTWLAALLPIRQALATNTAAVLRGE